MDDRDPTVVDVNLFKMIGLYQIISSSCSGGDRNWYRTVVKTFLGLSLALQVVQVYRLHLASDDFQTFTFMTVVMIGTLLCSYKGHVIVTKADSLHTVLDVARYAFTTYGLRYPNALHSHRDRLSTLLRTFAGISYVTLAAWVVFPGMMKTGTDNGADKEPTLAYTVGQKALVVVEGYVVSVNVFCWVLFDTYVITLCFVLMAQFRTLSAGYRALGHADERSPSIHSGIPTKKIVLRSDLHSDLINYLQDNQNIIKKYDDFFTIVQPVVYIQILIGTYIIIGLIFLAMLAYLDGWSILSVPVMKFMVGALSMIIQVFVYCYSFNQLESAKSAVNFELYSSNWTATDLKFKNTLLLAMNMNSSHKRTINLSPKSIVNLEMFARVMNISYTTVSVLFNFNRKLNK